MRPTYETEADRERERRVLDQLARQWRCGFCQFPVYSAIDGLFLGRGGARAAASVVCRTCSSAQYPTLIIGQEKVDRARAAAELLKVKLFLAIRWTDALGWLSILAIDFEKRRVNRHDRPGDDKASEPGYEIPIDWFSFLNGWSENAKGEK